MIFYCVNKWLQRLLHAMTAINLYKKKFWKTFEIIGKLN